MKKITLLLTVASLLFFNGRMNAQETCTSDANFIYYTPNTGWTNSEWYQIIDIDAEKLGNSGMMKHDGTDGAKTSTVWSSGVFTTPVYTYNESTSLYEPTSVLWPVNYYLTCINDTAHTSSWTKVNLLGSNPSGTGTTAACTNNNNTVLTSPIWNKKGFIELSRQGSAVALTPPSRHGYIQIDDLPQVERVQYSFSSTAWKRGFKVDIKYNDGPWEPLRWEANNVNNIATFAEQGYAFEEIIGKHEDPTSKISLRWRIWDGDSIHVNPVSSADPKPTFTTVNTPYATQQVVRIHQIKIFSGIVPTEAPNGLKNAFDANITVNQSKNKILLSEMATVSVFTMEGKQVYKGITKSIDVSTFSKGIYILRAVNKEGKIQNTKVLL